MKEYTLTKYIELLKEVKESGLSLSKYCKERGVNYSNITQTIYTLRKQHEKESELVSELLSLYEEVTGRSTPKESTEEIDTDERAETSYTRGEDGKIKCYSYRIYRKDRAPLVGNLTREEMNAIHRLYSYYGDALTQRVISRQFVDLSLIDFKRILRAFNITKASAPFAPHMIEEYTEDELREIQLREKENSFLRKAEEDQIRNNEKLLKKYAQENIELKKQLERASSFSITIPDNITPVTLPDYERVGQDINIYLSDIHLGGCVTSGSVYKENENYGFEEAKRRLSVVLEKLREFDCFDTINVVLMGDNIDCSGFYGKTARLDHDMPENMDPREQGNKYIELIMWFIASLVSEENALCSNLNVYSVPCGNHRF